MSDTEPLQEPADAQSADRHPAAVRHRITGECCSSACGRRERLVVLGAVGFIAVASFLLGANHSRFLTCEDFTLSGNSEPPGCTPGDV
ncbi:hypothetical protein N1028_04890 [Herbiconiux sp. CPCC 203407]|uniref:Uncharacterized protein n=1 Tax=Herbiconiux oxytropis TaxID=2970915 RepID=A0AA42BTI7_9MICO|nr:hypothetical protein [Herbiconiux oxytropis]MCS5722962.1 hypothetical protein [Herbiconiux oxytropis]MCS5725226.1 hypothetical protein [Herbiconiux oxytropis]